MLFGCAGLTPRFDEDINAGRAFHFQDELVDLDRISLGANGFNFQT